MEQEKPALVRDIISVKVPLGANNKKRWLWLFDQIAEYAEKESYGSLQVKLEGGKIILIAMTETRKPQS